MPQITYTPNGHNAYSCAVRTPSGRELMITGTLDSLEVSVVRGDQLLESNQALVTNLRAYAKHEAMYRRTRATAKRESHQRAAKTHRDRAVAVARMIEGLGDSTRRGWCSGCFVEADHRRVRASVTNRPTTYLCSNCGAPTTPCAVPRCKNLAIRGIGRAGVPRYCAEHRHDIPSFNTLEQRLDRIDDYHSWLKFQKRNAARATKVVGGAVLTGAVLAPGAFLAAPAIGGALGSLTGLGGSAATSHGLAMLGGGSLAAGGFGMAGGTVVVTAVGASLGGSMGAGVVSAYVRSDESFKIERLRDGDGPPVIFASGFLTQGQGGWGAWGRLIDTRYPEAPVYRVHWGAKELKALGRAMLEPMTKQAAMAFVRGLAVKGGRQAAKKLAALGPLAPLMLGGAAKNPWSVAKARSEMTGAVLADLIARTTEGPFILVGHSLGARVMVTAARALGTESETEPRIESIHLLGAAVGNSGDWRSLNDAVTHRVYNYYSTHDVVLAALYRVALLGQTAVGYKGFGSPFERIKDRNVSAKVKSHSKYFEHVSLAK